MNVVFKDQQLEKMYKNGKETGKPVYGPEVVKAYIKKIDILYAAAHSVDVANFRSLHLEALKKEKQYRGFHSIRVNDKYRIILKFIKAKNSGQKDSIEISEIYELTDYH